MARSIQTLKKDLIQLEGLTQGLADELKDIYGKYLNFLGESAQKALVNASYQICTQVYPQAFLKLSFRQRQKFHEAFKILAKQSTSQLLSLLDASQSSREGKSLDQEMMEKILLQFPDQSPHPSALTENLNPEEQTAIANPDELTQWYQRIEQGIVTTLKRLSRNANQCLQQFHLLPERLPPHVLDLAIQAEQAGQPVSGLPNLLNIMIEAKKVDNSDTPDKENLENQSSDGEKSAKVLKITAINLRIAEIEFSTPNLSRERHQIRNIVEKIHQLKQKYHKIQQECAVAEAESAWRASWYDD